MFLPNLQFFIMLVNSLNHLIDGDSSFNIFLCQGDEVLRRLEPIDILKADGRSPTVGALATSRLWCFIVFAEIEIHYFAFLWLHH